MIALDTETTGTNVRKDRVIGFSYFDGIESQYITHLAWNGKELVEVVPKAKCIEILSGFSDIIFHNAAFDIQIIKTIWSGPVFQNYCRHNVNGALVRRK